MQLSGCKNTVLDACRLDKTACRLGLHANICQLTKCRLSLHADVCRLTECRMVHNFMLAETVCRCMLFDYMQTRTKLHAIWACMQIYADWLTAGWDKTACRQCLRPSLHADFFFLQHELHARFLNCMGTSSHGSCVSGSLLSCLRLWKADFRPGNFLSILSMSIQRQPWTWAWPLLLNYTL